MIGKKDFGLARLEPISSSRAFQPQVERWMLLSSKRQFVMTISHEAYHNRRPSVCCFSGTDGCCEPGKGARNSSGMTKRRCKEILTGFMTHDSYKP